MTTKEIQHELARIATMTDKQLSVRYNRMTNEKKIKNFFDALVSTTRHITLQEKINRTGQEVFHCSSIGAGVYVICQLKM